MSAKSAVTTAMATRAGRTALERFASYTVQRDDKPQYFGNDGDVAAQFVSARRSLVVTPEGDYVTVEGASDLIQLDHMFGGKLPVLNANVLFSTDNDFEVLGANAVAADIVQSNLGGVVVGTHGAATDSTIILPCLTTAMTPWTTNVWATSKSVRWECDLVTDTALADTTIWAGLKLTNTATVATDNEQAFFRFHETASGGSWEAIYSIAGVDVTVDTAVDVAVSTRYHLVIDIDSSRIARFYINGVLVATSTALASGNLIPYVGVLSDTTATVKAIRLIREAIKKLAA